ncbi:senescence-inducible chloroplast stay-green protein [Striga asiatica]|uniref:Senescence-inducible chloroplast stay-green protein n=1 Tax=Striga asiatica TaxID=4170 RepID=A0A5A7PPZ1_STRAF|nr:senescence-inducible chloroplast stay-green protein [Striga asiatica]
MGSLSSALIIPSSKLKSALFTDERLHFYLPRARRRTRKANRPTTPLQGWYNRLQRDEVVAQWKKIKGKMSLHVHCHISGGHFLLDLCARLRYFIFCKELPVVLKAFAYADEDLLNSYPELLDALVWVYFHSNLREFNKIECWGPLKEASGSSISCFPLGSDHNQNEAIKLETPQPCLEACSCCFPTEQLINT